MNYDFSNRFPTVYVPDMSKEIAAMIQNAEEGKQQFIQQISESTGRELAKAIRACPDVFDEVVGALAALCGNPTYNSFSTENQMNDYVRDILGQGLQVRDQTRQGISGNSRSAEKGNAGELDIQIRNNGKPIAIYEGLRLKGIKSSDIHEHIKKATQNYNPQGVKMVFVVAYVQEKTTGFGAFWKDFVECVKRYNALDNEYQIIWDEEEEDTGLSSVRSIHGTYNLDDAEHNIHVMAVKIMK